MYQIVEKGNFSKTAKKFFKKHPKLADKFKITICKMAEDPFDTSLKMHKLKGKLKDYYAISLTYEFRIVLEIIIIDNTIYLIDIGTHDEVY